MCCGKQLRAIKDFCYLLQSDLKFALEQTSNGCCLIHSVHISVSCSMEVGGSLKPSSG